MTAVSRPSIAAAYRFMCDVDSNSASRKGILLNSIALDFLTQLAHIV